MRVSSRGYFLIFITCIVILLPAGVTGENIVMNGGFEEPALSNDYSPVTSLPNWSITAGDIEVIRTYWEAYESAQSIDLSGCSRGTIEQVLVTDPAKTYQLSFAMSGNPDPVDPSTKIRTLQVFWDDDPVRTYTFNAGIITSKETDMKWALISIPGLHATSCSTVLRFRDVSANINPCVGVALDNVIVTDNNGVPPVASFVIFNPSNEIGETGQYINDKFMVGGNLTFDATSSSGSGPLTYNWNFGDTEKVFSTRNSVFHHTFRKTGKFTITLTVVDGNTGLENSTTEGLDLRMKPGDLIFIRSGGKWAKIFDLIHHQYTHVGIYYGKINGIDYVIETTSGGDPVTHEKGVHFSPLKRWSHKYEPYATWVRVMIPTGAPDNTVTGAVRFAKKKLGHGYDLPSPLPSHNWRQLDKNDPIFKIPENRVGELELSEVYYCSELVWAAYYRASNGKVDLAVGVPPGGTDHPAVRPDDIIFRSGQMIPMGFHHEHYPS